MKKIIFTLLAFAGILSSCSNDDIEVSVPANIKVNPSGVISPFTYEINAGELESFSTDHKLRVRVLAYDEEGVLKASETQYLTNYASIASYNLNLEEGDYTLVAVTDVVEMDGSNITFEYWTLSDENKLATTRFTDAGYIGGKYKILGVASRQYTVGDGASECTLTPEPAGALCLVEWYNIHTFDNAYDYLYFGLSMSKSSDFIQFTSSGSYDISVENNDGSYDWRLSYLIPSEYNNSENIYGYYFILPMSNVNFMYRYQTEEDGAFGELQEEASVVDFVAGGEYWFCLDLNDEDQGGIITYACGVPLNDIAEAQNVKPQAPFAKQQSLRNNSVLYLKDIKSLKTR